MEAMRAILLSSCAQPLSVYLKSSPRNRPQSSIGPGRISDTRRLNEAAGPAEAVLWRFNRSQALRATPTRASTGATRAAVRAEEGRPSKALPHAWAPEPRFRVDDYTPGAQLDTKPLSSTAEQINIEMEPWATESSRRSPRRPSRRQLADETQG